MRFLTWNLNGRVKRLQEQVDAIAALNCDLVTLQEVKENTAAILRDCLNAHGFGHAADSFQRCANRSILIGPRRYGDLISSRFPFHLLPETEFSIPWPERVLSALIETPIGDLELHTTHIPPGSSNGWIKIETLEGIYNRLARPSTTRRILCGDFNTPKEEKSDGRILTWRREGSRWDLGERNIVLGLADYDLVDVYLYRHGYQCKDFSWYARAHTGRRFDHVFASRKAIEGIECSYLHSIRESRLSDHSPLLVDFARAV